MYAVDDHEIADAALGSGAEDAFWVLVCEDEEWLRAEFEAIVSEPMEVPIRDICCPALTTAAEPPDRGPGPDARVRWWRIGDRPEQHLTRERSPPGPHR